MIWIYSFAIIVAIIIPIYITETMTGIIIVAVVIAPRMIGIPEVIPKRMTSSLTSRTITT